MDLEHIQRKIHEIRGVKIILDFDLAFMYEVETRVLNQAVKRNMKRFPNDFMFQLTKEEWESISSQFVMTSRAKRPKSSLPYAFTEQGVAMLSGLLNSDIAINTNIVVMRAFVLIRQHEYPKNYEHAKYNDGFQRFFGGWGLCKKNCYPYIHDEKQIEIFSQQYKIMCAGRLPTIILEIFAELKQGVTALKLKMEY